VHEWLKTSFYGVDELDCRTGKENKPLKKAKVSPWTVIGWPDIRRCIDPSAAEFRRRRQPAPCREAATGKKSARHHASRNLQIDRIAISIPCISVLMCDKN